MRDRPAVGTRIVRELAARPLGRWAGQRAYRAVARTAAATLVRLPGVRSVYLAGSATRPSRVDPGYSDLDLVLVTELPALEDELRLRAALRRWLRVAHALVPALHQLDYLETRDLPLLRRYPNGWSMSFDERWEPLAGVDERLPSAPPLPARQRRLELLRRALRRWTKATVVLRDLERPDAPRNARRLYADVAAATLDEDRLAPLETLAARAGHGVDLHDPQALLGAALELLEQLAAELAPTGDARLAIAGAPPDPPRLDGLMSAAARAGLGPVAVASRDPRSTDRVVFVRAPGLAAHDAVARMRRVAAGRAPGGWVDHPVLLTDPLWRAGWLLDVPPFAAASLARAGEPPPAPSDADLRAMLPVLLVERVLRARGRGFRMRSLARGPRATWREIASLAPALEGLLAGEPIRFDEADPIAPDEAQEIAATRALAGRLRALVSRAELASSPSERGR